MRAFACSQCGLVLSFEATSCVGCGSAVGFDPLARAVVTLEPLEGDGGPRPDAYRSLGNGRALRRCANATIAACNWLVAVDGPHELCESCRLTRTLPDPDDPASPRALVEAEAAKRHLVFQLFDLDLPVVAAADDPGRGVAFDLLSSQARRVVTGHADGVITLDLAEADPAHRERLRTELGEPYRTLLGHFRHEIGHYYWPTLVPANDERDRFRARFGDERVDYGAALDHHYESGPPAGWAETHVSAYATMHPWEDWAETFAHYLHLRDTLQTAAAFGVHVVGPVVDGRLRDDPALRAAPRVDPGGADSQPDLDALLADWMPLTFALNAVNRSMGGADLYPFVLTDAVVAKLRYVHERVLARG